MAKWTEERKKKQAEAIKRWKTWEKSTGPKTNKGKACASHNACKHGLRSKDSAMPLEMIRLNKMFIRLAILYANHDSAVQRAVRRKRTIKKAAESKGGTPPPQPNERTDY